MSPATNSALQVLDGYLRELRGDTLKFHGVHTSLIAGRVVVWWVDQISRERREITRVKQGDEIEVLAALWDRLSRARAAPVRKPAGKVVEIAARAAGGNTGA